jgi:radical SAM superfamily enzyme YgiQ (UPF0313 family)
VDVGELVQRLRRTAPRGFVVLGGGEVPLNAPALQGEVDGWDYEIIGVSAESVQVLAQERLVVTRKSKSGELQLDIKPLIRHFAWAEGKLRLGLGTVEGRGGKVREIVDLLGSPPGLRVLRTEVYVRGERPLSSLTAAVAGVEQAAPG